MTDMAGDDAVRAATGRPFEEWVSLLSDVGAETWPHPRIARWLADDQGVDGWWAQNLTVRYEQATGRRQPGQQADGTFSASSSRSVPRTGNGAADGTGAAGGFDASDAFEAVVAAASAELGLEPRARREHELRPNARWTLLSGETALVAVEPAGGSLRIAVMFEKLPDSASTVTAKERAARILTAALGG
jgi:hypothetical protein